MEKKHDLALSADNNGADEMMPKEEQDKEFYWDDLVKLKSATAQTLLQQQALLMELVKRADKILEENPKLVEIVNGLALSYKDIANDIKKTMEQHMVDGKFKTGKINNIEDKLEYIEINAKYIAHREAIANLASIGYLDIFSQIKTLEAEAEQFKKLYEEANKENAKLADELGVKNGNATKPNSK